MINCAVTGHGDHPLFKDLMHFKRAVEAVKARSGGEKEKAREREKERERERSEPIKVREAIRLGSSQRRTKPSV